MDESVKMVSYATRTDTAALRCGPHRRAAERARLVMDLRSRTQALGLGARRGTVDGSHMAAGLGGDSETERETERESEEYYCGTVCTKAGALRCEWSATWFGWGFTGWRALAIKRERQDAKLWGTRLDPRHRARRGYVRYLPQHLTTPFNSSKPKPEVALRVFAPQTRSSRDYGISTVFKICTPTCRLSPSASSASLIGFAGVQRSTTAKHAKHKRLQCCAATAAAQKSTMRRCGCGCNYHPYQAYLSVIIVEADASTNSTLQTRATSRGLHCGCGSRLALALARISLAPKKTECELVGASSLLKFQLRCRRSPEPPAANHSCASGLRGSLVHGIKKIALLPRLNDSLYSVAPSPDYFPLQYGHSKQLGSIFTFNLPDLHTCTKQRLGATNNRCLSNFDLALGPTIHAASSHDSTSTTGKASPPLPPPAVLTARPKSSSTYVVIGITTVCYLTTIRTTPSAAKGNDQEEQHLPCTIPNHSMPRTPQHDIIYRPDLQTYGTRG
ncbi:hypothetical protein G7046_g8206 [Stylonectria norvegica]|nr:hypothetical protein G7046_g8206 [Stylonectria norvegica]